MPDLRPDKSKGATGQPDKDKEKDKKDNRDKRKPFLKTREGRIMIERHNELTYRLRDLLKPSNPLNLVYSPFPILAVFTIISQGARGTTKDEIVTTFKLPLEDSLLRKGLNYICSSHERNPQNESIPFNLLLYTQLYVKRIPSLMPEFYKSITSLFENADVEELNFEMKLLAAGKINDRFTKELNDHDLDFMKPIDLKPNTRVIILNAGSFYGKWRYDFDINDTKKVPFYVNKGKVVDVWMMEMRAKFSYAFLKDFDCHLLSLPYFSHTTVIMLFFVPQNETGLLTIEKNLKRMSPWEILPRLFAHPESQVHVFLPRFEMKNIVEMTDQMKELGIKYAFEKEKSDFSGISKQEGVFISRVFQRYLISVNEGGLDRPPPPQKNPPGAPPTISVASTAVTDNKSSSLFTDSVASSVPLSGSFRINPPIFKSTLNQTQNQNPTVNPNPNPPPIRPPNNAKINPNPIPNPTSNPPSNPPTNPIPNPASNLNRNANVKDNSIVVRMDHPFVFQIVDTETKFVLVSGILRDPTKISTDPRTIKWVKTGTSANIITCMTLVT